MNDLRPAAAVIESITEETDDVKTYKLTVDGNLSGHPRAGQFNMVGLPGVGEAPVSYSSLPEGGCFEHTIRAAGMVTGFIEKLEKGAKVFIRGPYGEGWPMERVRGRDLLIVAGGLGLAPLRPVIYEILLNRDSFGKVFFLYGGRNENSLLFREEYDKWERGLSLYVTVDELVTELPWKYHTGLITTLIDRISLDPGQTSAFICGPEIMMRFVCRELMIKGIHPSNLSVSIERRMKCGIAQCGHCQHGGFFVCRDGPVFPYAHVEGLIDGLL